MATNVPRDVPANLEARLAADLQARLEALRAAVDPAIADMKAGRTSPLPEGGELETILAIAVTPPGA